MNKILYRIRIMRLCMVASLLLAAVACSDDDNDFRDEPFTDNGSTLPESVSDLLNFTIAFDETDEEVYGYMEESIVTDPSADDYLDFVENYSFTTTVTVTYDGTTATIGSVPDGITLTQEGAHVVVNSTLSNVEYVLNGTTTDGSFKVYGNDSFRLSLSGVSITNPDGPAINIQSSERTFIMAEEGTSNSLVDGEEYDTKVNGESMKACLFSEGSLIFGGTGSLNVTGNNNHAITSDDCIRFRAGCRVTVEAAANDGIHTDNQITVGGGIIRVAAQGDGIQCGDEGISVNGGFIYLSSSDDGSDGLKAEQSVDISGGAIQVQITGKKGKGVNCASFTQTDGKLTVLNYGEGLYDEDENDISSAAGIKCDGEMVISGGQVALQSTGAAGKGINCDGSLTIIGGTVLVETTGKQYVVGNVDSSAKGIKADGDLTIGNDAIVLVKATGGEGSEGIESKSTFRIDGGLVAAYCYDDAMNASDAIIINGGSIYCHSTGNDGIDSNGTLTVTGGLTIAIGTNSPEGGIDCDQNTFSITGGILLGIGGETSTPTSNACTQPSLIYSGTVSSGSLLHIASSDGTEILTYKVPASYSRGTLLFSSPSLQQGSSYILSTGGSISGGTEFFGYYSNGTYTNGTGQTTFTLSSMVTTIGSSGGFGWSGGSPRR